MNRAFRYSMYAAACFLLSGFNFLSQDDTEFAEAMQQLLSPKTLHWGTLSLSTEPLKKFYASREFSPRWTENNELTPEGKQTLALLEHAYDEGLYPENYSVAWLRTLEKNIKNSSEPLPARLALEVLLTFEAAQYGKDLASGHVKPMRIIRGAFTHSSTGIDKVLDALQEKGNAPSILASFAPHSTHYAELKKLLQELRTLKEQGGWPALPAGKKMVPGIDDPRIEIVRTILSLTKDYNPTVSQGTLYDEELSDAVRRFQSRHGLETDGIIGGRTYAALTTPIDTRIAQIIVNMERLRWMPNALGERYLLINIPSYHLQAMAHGKQAFSMKVIVGNKDNPTPIFSNAITTIVFNPNWNVPKRIAVQELVPKIQEDPEFLHKGNFKLLQNVAGEMMEVDASTIDWHMVDSENFHYLLRQDAGEKNALGRIKFNLPNSNGIYLHSTSAPKLFAKSVRALSHGCIRLEKPRDVTHFILSHEGWSTGKIDKTYDSFTQRWVNVTSLPVHLTYYTTEIDDQGIPHFYEDVYGKDGALMKALQRPAKTLQ